MVRKALATGQYNVIKRLWACVHARVHVNIYDVRLDINSPLELTDTVTIVCADKHAGIDDDSICGLNI